MAIVKIKTGLCLPGDAKVEILLLQWSSAVPVDVGATTGISVEEAELKRLVLARIGEMIKVQPIRPTILLAPELSMPIAFLPDIEKLFSEVQRPMVFAFGFEFMTPERYRELAQGVEQAANLVNSRSLVNAAGIWLRDANGNLRRFLQSKRWVSKHEHKVTEGDQTFAFASGTDVPGERLNFIVSVCSDFTNPDNIEQLRREVLAAEITSLDFAFVLQMNEKQGSSEFCDGARAYFAPPLKLAETRDGALVFVNNAADESGNFGECKIHFPYRRVHFPDKAPPTFLIEERDSYNFDAAVFRDNRASLYALTYRPHYLVDQTAGSNQRTPFEQALHASLSGDLSRPLNLAELPAVLHWEATEVARQAADREQRARNQFRKDELAREWLDASKQSALWWIAAANNDDELARMAIQTLFRWNLSSSVMNPKTPEPTRWAIEEPFHRTIDALTLIRLAAPPESVRPRITQSTHADALGRPLVFLAGGERATARQIIEDFKSGVGIDAAVNDDLVIVLAQHRGSCRLQH